MFTYMCRLKLFTTSSYIVQNYQRGMYFLLLLATKFQDSFSELLFLEFGRENQNPKFSHPINNPSHNQHRSFVCYGFCK